MVPLKDTKPARLPGAIPSVKASITPKPLLLLLSSSPFVASLFLLLSTVGLCIRWMCTTPSYTAISMKKSIYFHRRGIGARGSTWFVTSTNLYTVWNRRPEAGFVSFQLPYSTLVFFQSKADYSMFTQTQGKSFTVVLLYIDDMIITGNNDAAIRDLKHFLSTRFKIKDLDPLKYFIGAEIAQSKSGISFSQQKYTLDILEDAGLLGSKPKKISMDTNVALMPIRSNPLTGPTCYRRLIGRLIYLTITRPEITYVVNTLSQFMHDPQKHHFDTARQLLHYLKGAPGQGMLFSSNGPLHLTAYCDADWARCPFTRRSITGYCIFLGTSLISWKKQEASHCLKVIRRSWIPVHGSHRLWTYLVTIPLTGSTSTPSPTCHLTLWQQSCPLYCSQSILPWTDQAHRIGLPHRSWENSKWRNQDNSCENTIPSSWHFHQATACTPIPILSSQVGCNRHSHSNLRGSVKRKDIVQLL